jgi:hypothetical protein
MGLLRGTLVTVAAIGLGIQFVRPARTNPPTDPTRTIFARAEVPAETAAVLERACRDCHSHDTRWPWYSNVAPVSWFVIDHVDHGRSHFNYSDWARYDRDEAARLIKESCKLSRGGDMPLPEYVRMHRETRLSPADVLAICAEQWRNKEEG